MLVIQLILPLFFRGKWQRLVSMKKIVLLFALCGLGCGSSGPNGPDLAKFTDTIWNGTVTATAICSGVKSAPQTSAISIQFQQLGTTGLTYMSASGCLFNFTVSENTASLSNSPVSCGTPLTTYETYVVSMSSDSTHLSGWLTGTQTTSTSYCTFSGTINMNR